LSKIKECSDVYAREKGGGETVEKIRRQKISKLQVAAALMMSLT
jgi:hypothetical protein